MAKRIVCPGCGKSINDVRRYHPDPLAEATGKTLNAACVALGVSGTTQQDARCHGFTRDVADRLAVRAGYMPWEVWPEMADHDLADHQRECAADDCTETFIGHTNRRYCTPQCKRRTQARRYRERHPENYRQQMRRWKADNAEAVRDYNRRYQRRYMRQWRAKKKDEAA